MKLRKYDAYTPACMYGFRYPDDEPEVVACDKCGSLYDWQDGDEQDPWAERQYCPDCWEEMKEEIEWQS